MFENMSNEELKKKVEELEERNNLIERLKCKNGVPILFIIDAFKCSYLFYRFYVVHCIDL